jgi:hypothetical protein
MAAVVISMSRYLYGLRNGNAPNLSAAEIGSRGALWIPDALFLKTSSVCPGCSARGDPVAELPERGAGAPPNTHPGLKDGSGPHDSCRKKSFENSHRAPRPTRPTRSSL